VRLASGTLLGYAADPDKYPSLLRRLIVKLWAPILLQLAVLGCAASLNEGTTFQPEYYPSGGAVPPAVPPCSGPIAVTVTDVRDTPAEAGRRFEENKPAVDYPIKITGDPTAYVKSALEAILKRAGNPGPGPTATTLAVTLDQLYLEEKTYANAEYSGGVAFEVLVNVANSPTPCWKGQITGGGTNYGKVGKTENYQETLNRAVEKATADMLRQKKFRDALCGKCASS
jgi:hypothetical protein